MRRRTEISETSLHIGFRRRRLLLNRGTCEFILLPGESHACHGHLHGAIVALCAERGIHLFNDEAYRGLKRDFARQLPQVAEVYEKGASLNVLSKAYGLPGLRIGWIASRDRALLEQMERMKHYLSICNSAPSEVLARIALKARGHILRTNRELCVNNLDLLRRFFADYPDLYEWSEPDGGCVGFALYKGKDGVKEHCRSLAEESGVLLLPSTLFQSCLLPVPQNRFRVGFGRSDIEIGLKAWRDHLGRRSSH